MAYVAPQDVRDYTGVKPGDLGKPDAASLDATLSKWIAQAEEMVTHYLGQAFTTVPEGVKNGTLRIVANMVAQAKLRRTTSIISIDEFQQRLVPDTVFTRSIRDDLEPYKARGGAGAGSRSGSITVQSSFRARHHKPFIELSLEAVPKTGREHVLADIWAVGDE